MNPIVSAVVAEQLAVVVEQLAVAVATVAVAAARRLRHALLHHLMVVLLLRSLPLVTISVVIFVRPYRSNLIMSLCFLLILTNLRCLMIPLQ